mgnify:CR=1 FL=1
MSAGDIRVASGGYGTRTIDTDDRDTSGQIQTLYGNPVKRGGTGSNFAVPVQDGEPENGTDVMIGIVNRTDTSTATVNGVVEVLLTGPGTILEGDASTSANIDTASELLGLMLDFVAFDVSATSVWTIDEDQNFQATQGNVGLNIVGGDIIRTRVFVSVNACTLFGSVRNPIQTA